MRINLHVPYLARQIKDEAREFHIGEFYSRLQSYLERRDDIRLTVSTDRKRPKHLYNAYCINYHTCIDAPRHLNIKNSYLPGFVYADAKGYSGWSELADAPFRPDEIPIDAARAFYRDRVLEPTLNAGISKFRQPEDQVALPDDYVFVPLQVPTDSVMKLAYFSQNRLVRRLCKHAQDVPVVFKVHPQTRKTEPEVAARMDALHDPKAGIHVVDAHVHDLIRGARAVICTNSGAGMEAVLLGKPVILCGKADYRHIVVEAEKASDLPALIEAAEAPSMRRVRRFAYWFFGQNMIDLSRPVTDWGDAIVRRLKATDTGNRDTYDTPIAAE